MTTMLAMHALWLNEVRNAFKPACAADSSVWARAKAVAYLREHFTPRFRTEREAAAGFLPLLQPATRTALRSVGDLIDVLCERLARLATFYQKDVEFTATAAELLRALDEWCSTLDAAAEQVREADLRPV
jgi:hypothetical protein